MPNLYGPNDNFDLESSHVLPALIRKFHLAKLANPVFFGAKKGDMGAENGYFWNDNIWLFI